MGQIQELYQQYRENLRLTAETRNAMSKPKLEDEWDESFSGNLVDFGSIYVSNIGILTAIEQICQGPLDDDTALELFLSIEAVFESNIPEYRMILPACECLIKYYENKEDYEKLIRLYTIRTYEINEVKNRQFSVKEQDFTDVDKIISLKDHYLEFQDVKTRRAVFMAYYSKIVIGMDNETVPPHVAFKLRQEMLELWEQPEVMKLDKNDKEILNYVNRVRMNVTDAIHTIENEDEETKELFCRLTKETYFYMLQKTKTEYELDPVLYASYLYVLYLHKEESLEDIFDDLIDFVKYGINKFSSEDAISFEALEFYINSTRILYSWAQRGIQKDKARKMVATFVAIAEKRWKIVEEDKVPVLNELMKQLCKYIVSYRDSDVEVEKCVYNMILQRNFFSYIHSEQIKNLVIALFEEAYEKMPSLFSQYSTMDYQQLTDFVQKCAVFHDIGTMDMIPFLYENMYPMSEEEEQHREKHPIIGAEFIGNIEEMNKFKDVILGHHKYYDGSDGFPKNYDNTTATNRIITDMIFVADNLDSLFDPFMQKGHNLTFEQIMEEFHAGKGTKYNPFLIEIIEGSERLRSNLLTLISSEKNDIIFKYYQALENMTIHQDVTEFMNEVSDKLEEVQKTRKYEEVSPYLDRMFEFAAREHSDTIFGKAYYYTMRYHLLTEEYMNAVNCGIEAIRYFEKSEEYLYISACHNSIGIAMQCQGNPENGIGHFLMCAEYANLAGSSNMEAIAYNNLASIFKDVEEYEKALDYYSKSEILASENHPFIINVYFNEVYCLIQMDRKEEAISLWSKIEELMKQMEENKEYSAFCANLYGAFLEEYLGNYDLVEEKLNLIRKDLSVFDDYRFYIEEINLYLDLLIKLQKLDELIEQLDIYIEYCREKHISHYIFNSFLQKRIMCAYLAKDFQTSIKVSNYLGKVLEEQEYAQADVTLQIENTYIKDMKRQRTRREMIDENAKLEKRVLEEKNASEAKTAFLSSMTHEIRTPIHAVIGLDEMILRESKDDQILQYAKDIQAAGKQLLGIVNDILDFSKMEAGKIEIYAQRYRLSDVLQELWNNFHEKAQEKKISFEIKCSPDIPNVLFGDNVRVKQVLNHLLSNAIKFTKEGSVTLSVNGKHEDDQSIELSFDVTDTGIGIKEDEIAKMMKPFERTDEDRNKSIEGTGLGLSIVNMLMKKMEGTFRVDSEYGKGSTFSVSLNQGVARWDKIGHQNFEQKSKTAVLQAPNAHILLVDDNAVNLKVITSLLKRTKIQITTASSGFECLEKANEMKYDLILLDHKMPEMDGIETIKRLKTQAGPNQVTNVIALTANTISGALEYYRGVGFQDFLPKPVDYHLLEEKVAFYLPKSKIKS